MKKRRGRLETRREFMRDLAIGAGGLVVAPSLLASCGHVTLTSQATGWDLLPGIMNRIIPPRFPQRDFVVTQYGAVGDGVTDCTAAFAAAIQACNAAGGGRVVVPAGKFLS